MNAVIMKSVVTRAIGGASLFLKANGPHIMVGVGIVGTVASTVLACKATLKLEEVKAATKAGYEELEAGREKYDLSAYSQVDYERDVVVVSVQGAVKIVKLYLPAGLLMASSIGLIIGGHYLLAKRTLAVMAAYRALNGAFRRYRDAVQEELGEEKEKELELKAINKALDVTRVKPEDGEEELYYVGGLCPNPYGQWFEEGIPSWRGDPLLNRFYLIAQQNHMNDRLHAKGHIFLNEVYDALGYDDTKEGAVVGWLAKGDGADGFVSFGTLINDEDAYNEFVAKNGRRAPIMLDFNVDGIIYDLI